MRDGDQSGKGEMPEHVEEVEGGGMVCRHCAGRVGPDGLALALAEAEEEPSLGAVEAKMPPSEDEFAEALSGGRR